MTRSIAVHSYKGGTGKSTLTANIAVALALKGRRVGVMDMDLEGPGLHVFFDIDPDKLRFTLNDVLAGICPPEAACVRMSEKLSLNGGELYYSPASVKVSEIMRTLKTGFELDMFENAIRRVQTKFGLHYLLIDTHPGIQHDTLLALGVCDHQIIVSRVDQQDIFGTGVLIEISSTLDKPVHLIMNMIPPRIKESEVLKFARVLGAHFTVDMSGWVPFSEEIIGSLSRSVLTLKSPKSQITSRFRQLAESVEGYA
ncbi:MAG TPA: MinD/ParA family protein [Candidatus Bathyarchaeia archaeon]|nr:MinD/ParA family protein [Candidatus Bathyarchaeia archaeon]